MISVREEAVLLIGNMTNVSEEMVEQTLDKKLMSNMRAKKSQHQREAHMVSAGEWSTGLFKLSKDQSCIRTVVSSLTQSY